MTFKKAWEEIIALRAENAKLKAELDITASGATVIINKLDTRIADLEAELKSLYKIMREKGMLEVAEEMLRRERETALTNFKAKASREDKMFKS